MQAAASAGAGTLLGASRQGCSAPKPRVGCFGRLHLAILLGSALLDLHSSHPNTPHGL